MTADEDIDAQEPPFTAEQLLHHVLGLEPDQQERILKLLAQRGESGAAGPGRFDPERRPPGRPGAEPKMRCRFCKEALVRRVGPPWVRRYEGIDYWVRSPWPSILVCAGEDAKTGEACPGTRLDEALTDTVAGQVIGQAERHAIGLLQPEEIGAERQALDLKQSELADRLHLGVESLSRWERGAVLPSRSNDRMLRAFFALESLQRFLADSPALYAEDEQGNLVPASIAPDEISRRRKGLGLRQWELAALLGVRPETLSRWESDRDAGKDRDNGPSKSNRLMLWAFFEHPELREYFQRLLDRQDRPGTPDLEDAALWLDAERRAESDRARIELLDTLAYSRACVRWMLGAPAGRGHERKLVESIGVRHPDAGRQTVSAGPFKGTSVRVEAPANPVRFRVTGPAIDSMRFVAEGALIAPHPLAGDALEFEVPPQMNRGAALEVDLFHRDELRADLIHRLTADQHPYPDLVRGAAARLLGECFRARDQKVEGLLVGRLESSAESDGVRACCAHALGFFRGDVAADSLHRARDDRSIDVRAAADWALARGLDPASSFEGGGASAASESVADPGGASREAPARAGPARRRSATDDEPAAAANAKGDLAALGGAAHLSDMGFVAPEPVRTRGGGPAPGGGAERELGAAPLSAMHRSDEPVLRCECPHCVWVVRVITATADEADAAMSGAATPADVEARLGGAVRLRADENGEVVVDLPETGHGSKRITVPFREPRAVALTIRRLFRQMLSARQG